MGTERRCLLKAAMGFTMAAVVLDVKSSERPRMTPAECREIFGEAADSDTVWQKVAKKQVLGSGSPEETEVLNGYISKANRPNQPRQIVGIKYDPASVDKAYALLLGDSPPQYFGVQDIDKLANRLYGDAAPNGVLYWSHLGFSNEKQVAAFEGTVRVQWAQKNQPAEFRSIDRLFGSQKDFVDEVGPLPQGFFGRNLRLDAISKPELVTEGRYKGWFKVLVDLTVQVESGLRSMVLALLIKSAAAAASVGSSTRSIFKRLATSDRFSPALLAAMLQREMRKQHPDLEPEQISLILQEEFGRNYLVELQRATRLFLRHG